MFTTTKLLWTSRNIFAREYNSQFTVWRKEDERTPGLLYRLQYSSRFVTAFFSVSLIITVCKIDRLKQISRNEVYLESRIVNYHFDTDLISHLYKSITCMYNVHNSEYYQVPLYKLLISETFYLFVYIDRKIRLILDKTAQSRSTFFSFSKKIALACPNASLDHSLKI